MVYRIVSAGKSFHVSYRIPADQVPSGNDVYLDVLDASGNYVGNPVKMTRLGSTDIVEAMIAAPSTPGKYILFVWIGTWDGTTRNIVEPIDYDTILVVSKDIEDRLSDVESRLSALESEIENIKKRIARHWA